MGNGKPDRPVGDLSSIPISHSRSPISSGSLPTRPGTSPMTLPPPSGPLRGRYELRETLPGPHGMVRHRAVDRLAAGGSGTVIVVRGPAAPPAESRAAPPPPRLPTPPDDVVDLLASRDQWAPSSSAPTVRLMEWRPPPWPGPAWEAAVLEHSGCPGLPTVRERFTEAGEDFIVEELPPGRSLWDAWEDPEVGVGRRYEWLLELIEVLRTLHRCGATPEELRPDQVMVTEAGRAFLWDVSSLVPLTPADVPPARPSFYTAPEMVLGRRPLDPRSALYSFGVLIYALHLGREAAAAEAARGGPPAAFLERFPEAHPHLARLVGKSFNPDPAGRFPTDDAAWFDPTGFTELAEAIRGCRAALERARLDVAAWTTTGMVRSGNEDAFALLHAAEARQDGFDELALVLLADGMGGTEAGEVASALTVHALRAHLLTRPPLARLAGPVADPPTPLPPVAELQAMLSEALTVANHAVFTESQASASLRGMGCTAEAVLIDGRQVVFGHVGDSRVYHWHAGHLTLLTRDQTLVGKLVELGHLTEEEAEHHPRRAELSQAVGGRPDVEAETGHAAMEPGDWVVVCSDGLSNVVRPAMIASVLEVATSAESAARRLVNLANRYGANDNATVVVVRGC
jgi:serine/threonine protein phosphatase PrpC